MTPTINYILSFFTVIAQLAVVFLIIAKITKNRSVLEFINKKNLKLSLVIVLGGIFGSLFYSEYVGYEPCVFCWWQRVFLYPQLVILSLALIKKDYLAARYIKALSIGGLIISGYQTLLQMNLVPSLGGCSATAVSCAKIYFINFGYITLPMMAFTAFALLTVLNWKVGND